MKSGFGIADNRQLAVVMFLDMVSYSARMAAEEKSAMACVADLEAILEETLPAFGGHLVKLMGDGSMSYFPTAGQAVSGALQVLNRIQERNGRFPPRLRFQVRVGLHLGDVVFEKKDLFGDAVNVAARVQPWADPGGIAMTGIVYSQVRNKIPLPGVFLPPVKLKNIPDEIPIFSLAPRGKNIFFWKLRKRRRELEFALLILVGLLLTGTMGYFRSHLISRRWVLIGVTSPGDENSRKTAETIRLQAEMEFSRIPGMRWINRETAFGILRQRGILDPVESVENLDLAAFHAAWKGGVNNLLLFQLEPAAPNRWKLRCLIFDAQARVMAASFSAEGPNIATLVGGLRRETQEWVERND